MLDAPDNHDFEDFLARMDGYHPSGHLIISQHCHARVNEKGQTDLQYNHQAYDTMSARDPIFYRWHGALEELLQQYRDKKFPEYKKEDFPLSDEVKVVNVKTVLENQVLKKVDNILLTRMASRTLDYGPETRITYRGLDHHPFKYEIKLENPQKSTRKVIVRIFLGLRQKGQERYYRN